MDESIEITKFFVLWKFEHTWRLKGSLLKWTKDILKEGQMQMMLIKERMSMLRKSNK